MQRRDFIKGSSLAAASLWLPKFLTDLQGPGRLALNGKSLVMIQLSGGNDGLNTVIPVRNDIYHKERPKLGIKQADALRLTDEVGLHPALTGLKQLYDAGDMAILNNVGYPNPDRSHFRSMDIWHTGSPADQYWSTGWIGRYLDAQCAGRPSAALEIDDTLSLALKGAQTKGMALRDVQRLYEISKNPFLHAVDKSQHDHDHEEAPVGYLYKTMAETLSSTAYLQEQNRKKPSTADYPSTELGRHLKTIASLILADTNTAVYYVSLGSFDTHINQDGQQKRLFSELNDAIAAFSKDLNAQGKWDEVLVATFSEFGRRVSQNASGGTDHGTANNMMFMGGGLQQKGLLNAMPNLSDLDNGDLKYQIDFRQVYATILGGWLEADPTAVMGQDFGRLGFV